MQNPSNTPVKMGGKSNRKKNYIHDSNKKNKITNNTHSVRCKVNNLYYSIERGKQSRISK